MCFTLYYKTMPRVRHTAWFIYCLIGTAVFLFPPWIVSRKEDYPLSFDVDWLFSFNFHYWNYNPVEHTFIHGHPAYYAEVSTQLFKQLNFGIFGIEIILLGVLGVILKGIIRWHHKSLCQQPNRPVKAAFPGKSQESEQAAPRSRW